MLKQPLIIKKYIALIIVLLIFGLFIINNSLSKIYFGKFDITGKDYSEAESIILFTTNIVEKSPIYFEIDGSKIETSYEKLGVKISEEDTLLKYKNHDRSSIVHISLFDPKILYPVYTINFDQFNSEITKLFGKYNKKPKNAQYVLNNKNYSLNPEEPGQSIDNSCLITQLKSNIEKLSVEPIKINLISVSPTISALQVEKYLDELNGLAKLQINLNYRRNKWELSSDTLVNMIDLSNKSVSSNFKLNILNSDSINIQRSDIDNTDQADVELLFDNEKLDIFINNISRNINIPTQNATLKFENNKVIEFSPARDGQDLDKNKLKTAINETIKNYDKKTLKANIEIPVKVTKAKIANKEINSLGIRELIGTGESYFAGSIPNRVFNLTLGAKRVSGVIIAPGDTFSFNNTVGDISEASGYKKAYVISSGRTVLDDGGGICQVSTTVFRAALNSGLPISARSAHAYRVGYYEQKGFKPGLDATVWSPAVDLKFKNDTSSHILVQAVVDGALSRMQVDIYGTLDNRKVELSEPVITNIRSAPEPLYQDDSTLVKGTTKQVDFAAPGANSVFTRKVYKENNLVIDEIFKSNYRPWQAVFLVGTGN